MLKLTLVSADRKLPVGTFLMFSVWFIISCRTSWYGNCLCNTCSIAIVGDESLGVSLRCLTAIELYRQPQNYAFHPLLDLQHNSGAFNTNNAFAMSISDTS